MINTKEIMETINFLKNQGIDLNNVNENDIIPILERRNNSTQMNIHTKMDWLVGNLLKGIDNRTTLVQNVNKNMEKQNFGIVRAPTGIGKSGIIYTDIFNRIAKNKDKKQIFIISTPLLCLNDQFFNDMIATLYGTGIISNKNCVIANVSSDIEKKKGTFEIIDENGNKNDTKIGMMSIDDACLELERDEIKIALVVSTHKSFNTMKIALNDVKKKFEKIEIGAYLDEEHTIKYNTSTTSIDINDVDEEMTDGIIDINSFKDVFTFLYAASATPRADHIELFKNMFSLSNPYVADIGAKDAIDSKDILPPHAVFCSVNDKKNNNEIEEIIKHIFNENNNINSETHVPFVKVLINCESTVELEKLRDYLVGKKYKVFYTTAKTGKHFIDLNGNKEYNSISDFSTAINEIQDNVVILHIRQVIAGVDISGLTHCIIRSVLHGINDNVKAIQTIGRTLRYFGNDRISIQNNPNVNLQKKCGSVYFVMNNDAEIEENFNIFEKFIYVNYNTSIAKCFDLKDHKITGSHRFEKLETAPFTKKAKTQSVNVAYIEYFMNQDIVKELIKQKADDYDILAVIDGLNDNFKTEFENDEFYSNEYLSIIKGYSNKLNDVLNSIKNAMVK